MSKYISQTLTMIYPAIIAMTTSCSIGSEDIAKLEEACQGQNLEELRVVDDLSAECRAAITELLDDDSDNVYEDISYIGKSASGSTTILYLAIPFSYSLEELSVSYISSSSDDTSFPELEFEVDVPEPPAAIHMVTDYSGSMSDDDIEELSALYQDFSQIASTATPVAYSIFSNSSVTKVDFTADQNALANGLAVDSEFDRGSTALFDAMGAAAQSLSSQASPLKILIVGTDGLENSSEEFQNLDSINQIRDENNIFTLMLGSFFASPNDLSELAGNRGGYIYTRTMSDMKDKASEFLEALGQTMTVTIDNSVEASAVRVVIGDYSVDIPIEE